MAHVSLHANARTEFGNGPTRRLRQQGRVPGIVYQTGGPSLALSLPGHDLRKALNEGRTGVIDLVVGDSPPRPVLVKDWQLHPVHLGVLHVDFQQVDLNVAVEAPVQISLIGSAIGVREGGVLDHTLREVLVSALPDSLPDHIEIDVSGLAVGDSVTVGDIVAVPGVTVVADPEIVVASVIPPTVAVEDEPVEDDGAAIEPSDDGDGDSSDE